MLLLLRRIPKAKPRRTTVEDMDARSSAALILQPHTPWHRHKRFFETTAYDAFVAAVENVVKTHAMKESSRLASEKAKEKTRAKEATNAAVVHHGKQNDDSPKKENTNDMQIVSFSEESHKPITLRMLKKVEAELKAICDENRERFIPDGLFVKLMPALDDLVDAACQTKLYSHGLTNYKAAYTKTAVGIEACVIILEAITANDVDTRIIDQDRIELCVNLCKHCLSNLIFPVFASLSDVKQKGLRSTLFKWAQDVHVGIGEIFTFLKRLVDKTSVTDSLLLQLTALSMDILTLDADKLSKVKEQVKNLQLDGIALLQQIFLSHEQHRSAVFEEIFGILHKLPGYHSGNSSASKRNLRLYSLIGLPIRLASPGIDLEKRKIQKEANTLTNT